MDGPTGGDVECVDDEDALETSGGCRDAGDQSRVAAAPSRQAAVSRLQTQGIWCRAESRASRDRHGEVARRLTILATGSGADGAYIASSNPEAAATATGNIVTAEPPENEVEM